METYRPTLEYLESHVERSYVAELMSELELSFEDAVVHHFVDRGGVVSEQLGDLALVLMEGA